MSRRLGGTAAAAIALLLLGAGTALAGGWATITPDDGSAAVEPKEDEPVVLGFTVLQHGKTPAPWEDATVVLTNALTGDRLEVAATADGTGGHFTATVTFPDAGLWGWTVELANLEVEGVTTTPVTVLTADGVAPALDAATAFRLADQAAAAVETELRTEYGERLNALENAMDGYQYTIGRLRSELDRVSAEQRATPAPAQALSPLAVILIAVLAGAASAFLMIMLARPGPTPAASDPSAQPGYAPTTR